VLNVVAITYCLLQIMTTDQFAPHFLDYFFAESQSNTDQSSDNQPSHFVRKSGWVYRVLFPNACLREFSFLTTFL